MKGLSIEEKAKAYDKVREKIAVRFGTDVAEGIFSEFEESEDERIRKALIKYFKNFNSESLYTECLNEENIIAWLEKQGEEQPIIRWHSINEEPEEMKELFCEWESDDATWHDVAFYDKESHTFRHAKMPINVTKWVYVDELLEEQAEVVSDKDDIEAEEKGIRKAFNKIWEEKQDKQKSQRMISAEAKEAMYDKPADTVEQKCDESETKIFDAPTPFEDKLYAFVVACEFLTLPSKIEFIKEHSQELLDAAREQIGKEQSSAWSEEDEKFFKTALWHISDSISNGESTDIRCDTTEWLKSLKTKVQPKQEWSEKDEEELEIAIDTLKESGRYDSAKWVQSLKQRIGG